MHRGTHAQKNIYTEEHAHIKTRAQNMNTEDHVQKNIHAEEQMHRTHAQKNIGTEHVYRRTHTQKNTHTEEHVQKNTRREKLSGLSNETIENLRSPCVLLSSVPLKPALSFLQSSSRARQTQLKLK